jgi:hypothetical protein
VSFSFNVSFIFQLSSTQSLVRICAQLQIHIVKVSFLSKKSCKFSLISSDFNTFVAPIQEAHGSSHQENHPGTTSISVFFNFFANSNLDFLKSSGVNVLKTCSLTINQTFNKAFLVSSSELVQGKTGINAIG